MMLLTIPFFMIFMHACSDNNDEIDLASNVLVLTNKEVPNYLIQEAIDSGDSNPSIRLIGDFNGGSISLVKLRGKTNHFGKDINTGKGIDYHATVPDARVWIAEYPETRDLNIRTDETGWWTMYVVKDKGVDLDFSFIYEKDGWVTTKTNVIGIKDEDDIDFAIQFIDPSYFNFAMVPTLEQMFSDIPDYEFKNAMVVTVGKSWASMHSDWLPHGDPGATVTVSSDTNEFIGPVYFNKSVVPDRTQEKVSVDGGVAWLNMPVNHTYAVTAEKEGVNYPTVKFNVTDADVENGVKLYIASPPDSLEGDNDSLPGKD